MRYESIEISTISEIENASYSVGGERTGAEMWMGARGGVDGRVRGGRVGWVGVEKGRRGGGWWWWGNVTFEIHGWRSKFSNSIRCHFTSGFH
jgi:hypothetical protein